MLIGRKQEVSDLSDALKSDKAEFIAVYGRRRMNSSMVTHRG